MSNSDAIAFMIFVGYIVFTTMNDNLVRWREVLGLSNSSALGEVQ